MSEPMTRAQTIELVAPGIWRWHLFDDRIDFESDAHAVASDDGVVLIDPLPLAPRALRELGKVAAICLTAACHQRSAWRYRKKFAVKVYAPRGAREMDEAPDASYGAGEVLPGGLKAVPTPGPEPAHYAFLRRGRPSVLFCPDLLMRADGGALEFVPPEFHEDPVLTRRSVRRLLGLRFSILCLDHGAPITRNPRAALREVLARDEVKEP
jgi:glyoxylase-like metal-dependent hydrolase (beta-lactamase superfamily II)